MRCARQTQMWRNARLHDRQKERDSTRVSHPHTSVDKSNSAETTRWGTQKPRGRLPTAAAQVRKSRIFEIPFLS